MACRTTCVHWTYFIWQDLTRVTLIWHALDMPFLTFSHLHTSFSHSLLSPAACCSSFFWVKGRCKDMPVMLSLLILFRWIQLTWSRSAIAKIQTRAAQGRPSLHTTPAFLAFLVLFQVDPSRNWIDRWHTLTWIPDLNAMPHVYWTLLWL